ncbi:RusA family crossover junction endodeoxyribonuclease [Kocuria indica]|uniref:RusA family crossover junction endodeoxyribonuclease n=1 Tax=Kocuria marina subsp. indica TaxID=1049583 RepID=A0A6N9R0T3_9MICC|nr:RusA family crossover junction endodeoxyribonuclease [Kocuria indica]NDO78251.1 RusA family crossover junction endodeoxyribonuclease [Kocuria indica]
MRDLTFFVPGKAAAQGSKKHVGRGVMVEMSKDLPAWRAAVARAARDAYTGDHAIDAPVSVALTVYIQKPKTTKFRHYPAGPPDADKLQRGCGDALTASGVIRDDARIVHWDAWKRWATDDTPPGALITITTLEEA